MGRAGIEYGAAAAGNRHVVGIGKGRTVRAGEGRYQANYEYQPNRPPPTTMNKW